MDKNNGYLLYNADGTKPKATVAALLNENGATIIVEGKKTDILTTIGVFAHTLVNEKKVMPKEVFLSAVNLGIGLGDDFLSLSKMIDKVSDEFIDKMKKELTGEGDAE